MRVLLVEDDDALAESVVVGLRRDQLAVDRAATFEAAVDHLIATTYDVACLDLGLPDGDGIDLCRLIQRGELRRPRRILMLTARDAVADRIAGLDGGADDYLVKPFAIAELAARIRALTRRGDTLATTITVGDLEIDTSSHRASRNGRDLQLTGREFAVLRYLCLHQGHVISAEELLEHCWDAHADPFTGSVRVILSRLRHKLGDPVPIITVRGAGYRLEDRL